MSNKLEQLGLTDSMMAEASASTSSWLRRPSSGLEARPLPLSLLEADLRAARAASGEVGAAVVRAASASAARTIGVKSR